jgi:hypothetical protein
MARTVSNGLTKARERMRLLLAAAALFVLLLGLVGYMFLVLDRGNSPGKSLSFFGPFFATGVLLLLASAFINNEGARTMLASFNPVRRRNEP